MSTTKWSKDFDLCTHYQRTIKSLKEERQRIAEDCKDNELTVVLEKLQDTTDLMPGEIERLLRRRKETIIKLIGVRDAENIKEFARKVKPILDAYKKLGPKLGKGFKEKDDNIDRRRELIREYGRYLALYTDHRLVEQVYEVQPCDNCDSVDIRGEEDTEVCMVCGFERCYAVKINHQGVVGKTEMNKFTEDRSNFIRILGKYLGKKPSTTPSGCYDKLDKYFRKQKKYTETRDTMRKALHECCYSQLVEDLSYHCHAYWNTPLPTLNGEEQRIIADYDMMSLHMDTIKKVYGKGLNLNYRLKMQLKFRGFVNESRDFKEIKTEEVEQRNYRMWTDLLARSGMNT